MQKKTPQQHHLKTAERHEQARANKERRFS
jgi:hypothetical protein